jgi:TRAP-type C4-dicarboxylate transport system substrate-binding protein
LITPTSFQEDLMTIKKTISILTIAAVMFAAAPLMAKDITMKYVAAIPKGTPWITHAEKTATNMETASAGNLKMDVFPSAQLGNEFETIKQVASGRLDIGGFSVAAAATVVPEVMLMVSPFFWDNFAQADCAIDTYLSDVYGPLFEKKGLKIVQWQELGWQILFSKKAITTPEQVKGFKMRVSPAINHNILWRGLGANGVPMAYVDTTAAVQTGVVDGGELPSISYIISGLGKVAPHLTRTNHVYQPSLMLMSLKTWKKMSDDQKKIFNESLESAQDLRKSVRGLIGVLEKKHVAGGGIIHDLNDEQKKAWKDAYTDEMQAKLIKEIGGDATAIFEKIKKARNSCPI